MPVRYSGANSRLVGHHNWVGLGLFIASLIYLGGILVLAARVGSDERPSHGGKRIDGSDFN